MRADGPNHADGPNFADGTDYADGPNRADRLDYPAAADRPSTDDAPQEDGQVDGEEDDTTPSADLLPLREAGAESVRSRLRWQFGRPQLVVVAVVVAIGVLLGGWAVLRARPIALASPQQTTGTAAPTSTAAAASASGGPSPTATQSGAPPPSAPKIQVHVLGAVRKPGVVRLQAGARVKDALKAAGGVRHAAALGDLNLAQPLDAGQQLFVSRNRNRTEVRDPGASSTESETGSTAAPTAAGAPQSKINLNTATTDQLDQLPGVGPVTAQKIISWREQHQRFSSVQELQEVDGIGPKTFADLEPLVTAP